MKKHKMKIKTKEKTPRKTIFSLFPPELPNINPLPLIIQKDSPAEGTYLILSYVNFVSRGDEKDKRTINIAIVDEDEDTVLIARVGWENAAFYVTTGYTVEEAQQLRFGLLMQRDDTLFPMEVLAHFRKMVAENPVFTDYLKEQYRKFNMTGREYDAYLEKTQNNLARIGKGMSKFPY